MSTQPKPGEAFQFGNRYPDVDSTSVPYLINTATGEEGDVLTKDANNQPAWETPITLGGAAGELLSSDGNEAIWIPSPVWERNLLYVDIDTLVFDSQEVSFTDHVSCFHLGGLGLVTHDEPLDTCGFALRLGATVNAVTTYLSPTVGILTVDGAETHINDTWLPIDTGTAADRDMNVWFDLRFYTGSFGICSLHMDGAFYDAIGIIPFSFRGQTSRIPMTEPDPTFIEFRNTAAPVGPSGGALQLYLMGHGTLGDDSHPDLVPPF